MSREGVGGLKGKLIGGGGVGKRKGKGGGGEEGGGVDQPMRGRDLIISPEGQ